MRHVGAVVMDVSRNWEGGQITRRPREIELALPLDQEQVGTVHRWRITLPFLPPSKNQFDGLKGEWRSSVKAKWIRHIVDECEAQNLPKGLPRIALSARLEFPPGKVHRDVQNYSSTLWNFVPDALEAKRHGWRGEGNNRRPMYGYGLIPDDRTGRIMFGKKDDYRLGIVMAEDLRNVDKKHAGRTIIVIAARLPI